jgi:hypothetical protein
MATYQVKCTKCGSSFSTTSDMSGLTGRGTCPDCKRDENRAKSSSSSSFPTGANVRPIIVKKGPSADEIRAEAEVERMERDDNASQPWKFDSNFYSSDSVSKISYPDTPEDIEKTILRITKTAIDKIKSVIEISHAEFQQQTMGDQKAMWKPFYEEIKLVDTCIEKANEGIKKLRRFEGNAINAMMADCQDSLDDLKDKWYVKLIEKRDKKKKQTKIMVIVIVVLVAAMMIGLAIAS